MLRSMNALRISALSGILLLWLTGCHSLTIVLNDTPPPTTAPAKAPGPESSEQQGSVLVGIYSISPPKIARCPRGLPVVHIITGFLDNLIHFFIGPIYTTRTVEVYCTSP